ncbi:MAG: hypothetical protein IPG42_15705 [Betaproteobacteria bacterium]|nr:hypothetical protein [Betaproteobacteria bacterium]
MVTSGTTLAELDPWQRIDAMPANRPLKTGEAAVFMTFSIATLERMRVKGTGPDYFQGGMRRDGSQPAPEGTNQHIRYFKEDIQAWWDRGKVSSTMQAAKLKGQLFTTIFELAEEHPFYINPVNGGVEGMVENTAIGTVIERVDLWDIIWMPATEAASRCWSSLSAHKNFASKIQSTLTRLQQGIASNIEATELSESTPPRIGSWRKEIPL